MLHETREDKVSFEQDTDGQRLLIWSGTGDSSNVHLILTENLMLKNGSENYFASNISCLVASRQLELSKVREKDWCCQWFGILD